VRIELQAVDTLLTWREAVSFFGFPKRKEKAVVTDVTGLLPPRATMRLSTNQEIYWDAAALAVGEPASRARLHTLVPEDADLHYRGFSALRPRASEPHLFAYDAGGPRLPRPGGALLRPRDPPPARARRPLRGMNAGDEMTVVPHGLVAPPPERLDALLAPLHRRVGQGRRPPYVAFARVEPLPYHGMKVYPDRPRHRYPSERNRGEPGECIDQVNALVDESSSSAPRTTGGVMVRPEIGKRAGAAASDGRLHQ